MVDFDKFEKNVKSKYGNQEFPFDEQNWEKAAKMIDASRKGKNRGGIFLLSAVALLCTSGLVYYFGFSDSSKALQKKDLATNQVATSTNKGNNSIEVSVSENNQVTTTETNSNGENVQSNSNTTSSNESAVTNNSSSSIHSSKTKSNSTHNTTSASNVNENTSAKLVAENTNNTSSNETKAETTTSASNSNETKSSSPKTTESKKPTVPKSTTKAATPPVLGSNTTAQSNGTVKPSTPIANVAETGNTNKTGDIESTTSTQNPTKNNSAVEDSSSTVVTTTVKPTESIVVDSVPPIRKSKADSLAAMAPKGDGVSYATNVKEKQNAKNILFMEAGTTYLLGWNGGGKTEAGGFNLLAGFNFQHYFTGSIAAQIGVQYSTIGNLTNTSHTISTVKYDLGVEQDITSIKYQKLHYLVAPVKLTFNVGDKNIFGVGCNVAYLLNSDSKKEKYKTYSSDPNATKNNLTSTKESGYVQGFNPFDIQVGVSYRRKIYKGLSANAEFFYGLTDTKNNDFFKSNYFDRNTGFKVSLCYDLFKK